MRITPLLLAASVCVVIGCSPQHAGPVSPLAPYLHLPPGSHIAVQLCVDDTRALPPAPSPLVRATGRGIFEGSLISVSAEELVLQPAFARIPVHFGASVIKSVTVLPQKS